ncbi:hypothetical protein MNL09_05060 [Bartonella krasnovii]|uniref:hypothetical protein n=1 Tax=Bartonella krasnovii TaxID=2267275 RepID=UPI001F4C72E9|nr:hypothetical protein [Bartonella krasnovii]UNF39856.1 hypothetical protein MNL09_05060 [Bartonella krasnovii]UNF44812.1 hypothetical protein MNL06_04285 [Bartonella krasnovii]
MIKTVQEKNKNDSYEEFQVLRATATLGAGKVVGGVMIMVLSIKQWIYTISRVPPQNGYNERWKMLF